MYGTIVVDFNNRVRYDVPAPLVDSETHMMLNRMSQCSRMSTNKKEMYEWWNGIRSKPPFSDHKSRFHLSVVGSYMIYTIHSDK